MKPGRIDPGVLVLMGVGAVAAGFLGYAVYRWTRPSLGCLGAAEDVDFYTRLAKIAKRDASRYKRSGSTKLYRRAMEAHKRWAREAKKG